MKTNRDSALSDMGCLCETGTRCPALHLYIAVFSSRKLWSTESSNKLFSNSKIWLAWGEISWLKWDVIRIWAVPCTNGTFRSSHSVPQPVGKTLTRLPFLTPVSYLQRWSMRNLCKDVGLLRLQQGKPQIRRKSCNRKAVSMAVTGLQSQMFF